MSGAARRGLLVNVASAALPLAGSFVVSILLAPYVGDAGFGVYSLVMSLATLMLVVAKFGIHTATSRLVSEHDDAPGPWIRAGIALRIPFTVVTALVAWAAAPWIAPLVGGAQGSAGAFALAAAIIVGASAFEFTGDVLVGLRSFGTQFGLRLAFLVLRLTALGLVRVFGLGVEWFLFGHALAQFAPGVLVLLRLVWRSRRDARPDVDPIRRTWQVSVPLALSSASFLVYAHTDRLMLGFFHDPATVGQYAVARNVIDAALFPVIALSWSLRPALVRALRPQSEDDAASVLDEGFRLSVIYSCGGVALLGVLGPPLLRSLYGLEFDPAARLLWWLLPVLALRGIGTVVFPALLATDAQSTYARLMAWTAGVNAAVNLALIPRFGAEGAIAGTTVALLVLTLGGFREVRRNVASIPWRRGARSHLSALIVAVATSVSLVAWGPGSRSLLALLVAAGVGTAAVAAVAVVRGRTGE